MKSSHWKKTTKGLYFRDIAESKAGYDRCSKYSVFTCKTLNVALLSFI